VVWRAGDKTTHRRIAEQPKSGRQTISRKLG
jgi:hypothetical protein